MDPKDRLTNNEVIAKNMTSCALTIAFSLTLLITILIVIYLKTKNITVMQEINISTIHNLVEEEEQYIDIQYALSILRALNNPRRQKMLKILSKEMQQRDIYLAMRMEQSATSSDLAILRRANLVTCKRVGRRRMYIRNEPEIVAAKTLAGMMVKEVGVRKLPMRKSQI